MILSVILRMHNGSYPCAKFPMFPGLGTLVLNKKGTSKRREFLLPVIWLGQLCSVYVAGVKNPNKKWEKISVIFTGR